MKKLFFKTLVSLLLFLSLAIFILYIALGRVAASNMKHSVLAVSQGTMNYYITQLASTNQSEWTNALRKLQVGDNLSVRIIPINKLPISQEQKKQLYSGQLVVYFGQNALFFNEGVEAVYVCQRIPQSDFALVLEQGATPAMMMQNMTQWIRHAIYLQLSETNRSDWSNKIKSMQNQYGFPLTLVLQDQQPKFIQNQLAKYNMAFLLPSNKWSNTKLIFNWSVSEDAGFITTFYMPTPDKKWIVKAGPIKYSYPNKYFSSVELILAYIFSIVIVIILTWLFSRNIHKIYKVTEHYRQGDFDYRTKLSRFSTLHDLYINIINTGKDLKNHIDTQHNMMRFVAHETRTPLSTMQLAYEQLSQYKELPKNYRDHLENIKEDIDQLNELITDFLLYSQVNTHELTLDKQRYDIIAWLNEIIKRYSTVDVYFPQNVSSIDAIFDRRLLKHAITNLLTNALKFAHHKVSVSLEVENDYVIINIDDDGPGVSIDDHDTIFNPFTTLQNESDYTKHLGLGLNIANSIVALHGGTITVEDSQLGGARFIVRIPIC